MQIEWETFQLQSQKQRELVHRLLSHAQSLLDGGDQRLLRFETETSHEWHLLLKSKSLGNVDDIVIAFESLFDSVGC
jgi:hypothetical protein